jgi:hypothetical protein
MFVTMGMSLLIKRHQFRPYAVSRSTTTTVSYPFGAANEALADLREGRLQGAAVLVPSFVEAQSTRGPD